MTNIFQIAGLSHIIVLSGYNITVVASAVMSVLSFLPRTAASSFGILSIILLRFLLCTQMEIRPQKGL